MKLCNEICNDGVFNMQTILYANIIRVTNSPLKFPYVVDDLITGRLNLRTRLKVYGLRTQNVKLNTLSRFVYPFIISAANGHLQIGSYFSCVLRPVGFDVLVFGLLHLFFVQQVFIRWKLLSWKFIKNSI